ncbi:MAG: ribonuclease P protein component [Peptoniphilus sp.]|nr:ribonuclease P protein component [Peptoniphilus sp.]MDD7363539.1 ribonuclease P protein component [Bacillota bacterium]MDY6044758.1 ribonuclease P protein component [Peptoniphilus sp.]
MEKKYFLKKDEDFKKVYKKRKTFGNRNFTLYIRRNGLDHSRMGFSINKKVGKAVVRNKIKRRLRALYGDIYPRLVPGYDLVVVVKNNVADLNFKETSSAFYHLMRVSKMSKGGRRS